MPKKKRTGSEASTEKLPRMNNIHLATPGIGIHEQQKFPLDLAIKIHFSVNEFSPPSHLITPLWRGGGGAVDHEMGGPLPQKHLSAGPYARRVSNEGYLFESA